MTSGASVATVGSRSMLACVVIAPIRRPSSADSIPRSPSDPPEIDQVLEPCEPHGQHRNEALATCQHLRVVAVLDEQLDGFFHRFGRVVREPSGLHAT